ncbi:hypothetical protein EDC04DRAFT_2200337 [Pisolithus marmoratus]|nr:hypothetical protein EDC04DRAFT_2200337 [Pisolithus marmoratus]
MFHSRGSTHSRLIFCSALSVSTIQCRARTTHVRCEPAKISNSGCKCNPQTHCHWGRTGDTLTELPLPIRCHADGPGIGVGVCLVREQMRD